MLSMQRSAWSWAEAANTTRDAVNGTAEVVAPVQALTEARSEASEASAHHTAVQKRELVGLAVRGIDLTQK